MIGRDDLIAAGTLKPAEPTTLRRLRVSGPVLRLDAKARAAVADPKLAWSPYDADGTPLWARMRRRKRPAL